MTEVASGHHCPFSGCLYANGSERCFASKRFLTQHINKVHAEKKFACAKCQKGFGSDWWRKYHEKTCGTTWVCSCGMKYLSRESLLTHARRNQHDLSSTMPRKTVSKEKPKTQPVVYFLQPIVHQVSLVLSRRVVPSTLNAHPLLLPKCTLPMGFIPPVVANEVNQSIRTVPSANIPLPTVTSNALPSKLHPKEPRNVAIKPKTAAQTQTCEDLVVPKTIRSHVSVKNLESRGSQCSGRVTKQRVRIESTHTQTNESTVVKMKKCNNRSRRSSVAVLTESAMVKPTQSLWSDLNKYIIPSSLDGQSWSTSSKNSSSTQTNSSLLNKIMCDSQTLTEDDLFNWTLDKEQTLIEDDIMPTLSNVKINLNPKMLPMSHEDTLETSTSCSFDDQHKCEYANTKLFGTLYDTGQPNVHISCDDSDSFARESEQESTIPFLGGCGNPLKTDINKFVEDKSDTIHPENMLLDSMFSGLNTESDDGPLLLHSHTQTNSFSNLDVGNILSNMETQTSEDFFIPDLEFLDNETQTPWEDIQSIEDNFNVDQFSIEIQTDLDSAFNLPNIKEPQASARSKIVTGIHMETQTQDMLLLPHVTNSEAQTLMINNPLFE